MNNTLSFDDVLLVPQFSTIKSRKDVDISTSVGGLKLDLPIISSNMDTVTNSTMAWAMMKNSGIGALHRFMSIEDNIIEFGASPSKTIVSFGLGVKEMERAEALFNYGASFFLIDVAHGASMEVVNQVKEFRQRTSYNAHLIVGNFATGRSINDFLYHLGDKFDVDAYKVGIGGGSACLTRVVTGCGMPTLASIIDCATSKVPIIGDGGCRNSGDIAKALAAGASAVMLGGMLAGTDETPGEVIKQWVDSFVTTEHKKYRGSASTESYLAQGKVAGHRSHEGDSFLVPYKGSVAGVLQQIEGGLRSALSYVGATNLEEFRERAEFVQVTGNGVEESGSHGKSS